MSKLYYTAPPQKAFDDMKQAVTEIWNGYEDPYRSEKLARIEHMQNIQDNFMYLFAMLDHINQGKVVKMLKEETKQELRARMVDGGNEEWHIAALGL